MNLSIVDYNKKEYFINNHLLNYVVYAEKRYIKPNQNIKVKIYYIKEQIESIISTYPFIIWLHDVNDRYWKQPLEVQQNDISIENTILSNRKDFIEHTNIDKAIDCFKEPHNW